MLDGLAAAAVVAVASVAVAVLQARKTRELNTREHGQTARTLKKHGRRLDKIARSLDAHLDDHHRRNGP